MGSSRWGAAAAAMANLEENSPNDRCSDRWSISPKVAASQNAVVPPFPRITSYPSGSEKRSCRPDLILPTRAFTGGCLWLVPRSVLPSEASTSTWSVRTFEGPLPNRPSDGRRCSGIEICSGVPLVACHVCKHDSHGSQHRNGNRAQANLGPRLAPWPPLRPLPSTHGRRPYAKPATT